MFLHNSLDTGFIFRSMDGKESVVDVENHSGVFGPLFIVMAQVDNARYLVTDGALGNESNNTIKTFLR